jgi:uncharacterized protein YuzE
MKPSTELAVNYDSSADVLYLAVGSPVPADIDEDEEGLLVRFAKESGSPCGVTVLGFASQWDENRERLASLVGGHLHLPIKKVAAAIAAVQR